MKAEKHAHCQFLFTAICVQVYFCPYLFFAKPIYCIFCYCVVPTHQELHLINGRCVRGYTQMFSLGSSFSHQSFWRAIRLAKSIRGKSNVGRATFKTGLKPGDVLCTSIYIYCFIIRESL